MLSYSQPLLSTKVGYACRDTFNALQTIFPNKYRPSDKYIPSLIFIQNEIKKLTERIKQLEIEGYGEIVNYSTKNLISKWNEYGYGTSIPSFKNFGYYELKIHDIKMIVDDDINFTKTTLHNNYGVWKDTPKNYFESNSTRFEKLNLKNIYRNRAHLQYNLPIPNVISEFYVDIINKDVIMYNARTNKSSHCGYVTEKSFGICTLELLYFAFEQPEPYYFYPDGKFRSVPTKK